MEEKDFEEIKIKAKDLKEHDILVIDEGKYTSEVFIITMIVSPNSSFVKVMSKGIFGGADEFKFKTEQEITVCRRKSS